MLSKTSQAIDGKFVVLTDKTALPPRCVRTNLPLQEHEYRTWDLPWIPGWLKFIMLVAPAFLLFTPFVVRRRCYLKAGLSPGVRFRFFLLKLAAGLLILGSLFVPIACAALDLENGLLFAVVLFPISFWGGFVILILFSSPLSIGKHEGDLFWVRGCSPVFLESLRDSLEAKDPIAT